jgi:hypothetical protein
MELKTSSHAQRQNKYVSLVAFTYHGCLVVGTVYPPGESPVTENEFSPDSGIVGEDSRETKQALRVSRAATSTRGYGYGEKWMNTELEAELITTWFK